MTRWSKVTVLWPSYLQFLNLLSPRIFLYYIYIKVLLQNLNLNYYTYFHLNINYGRMSKSPLMKITYGHVYLVSMKTFPFQTYFIVVINNVHFWYFSAYLFDKVKIKGYYAFKLTEERSKRKFGFFTSDFKAKSSIQFYNHLINNSGFPSENSNHICSQMQTHTDCTGCLLLSQKTPLIFFGCCLFSTVVLLLSLIIFHKRKRRTFRKTKNIQHIPLEETHKKVLS